MTPRSQLILLAALLVLLGGIQWRNMEVRRSNAVPSAVPSPPRALSVALSPENDFTLLSTAERPIQLAGWRGGSPLVLCFFATD